MSETMFEPFAGSLAVLLGRPYAPKTETVNDACGFIANTWRALAADPEAVARWADWPAMECDLHARHVYLKSQRATLTARLEGDPAYYDAKIAGWWLWGVALWIGGGWCSPTQGGPWHVRDGQLVDLGDAEHGVKRQRLHLGNAGQGVHRQLVHLGDAGRGVHRRLVHLGNAGQGVHRQRMPSGLLPWFQALQDRLRRVRVCCGDWLRVMGPSVLETHGLTGVVLDPPYLGSERDTDLYGIENATVAHAVRAWAIAHGENPLLRIVLCGYETTDYSMPSSWETVRWVAQGGMGNQGHGRGRANAAREKLWFSPHCLSPEQPSLFAAKEIAP